MASCCRLREPEPPQHGLLFKIGSSFQYCGRTEYQTRQAAALIDRPGPSFDRTVNKRFSGSRSSDAGDSLLPPSPASVTLQLYTTTTTTTMLALVPQLPLPLPLPLEQMLL